ncbi:MAG: phenylalanine--tRNA ligase subunit beta [Gammaproteobacteria bacterium]|nr:phenylalanine--tRNA ligase subunit beta [Gammaproteobacteria bacterium]MBT8105211.1 phenylalanine--tRNA ligase subunit beta [Gammaproteobacteria bacterium]NNF50077.1 phenylalanine--tRNA ligase subunit beta [Woeseiaceae bacterium]NNK25225.1 phenylalanine--tRNA ligase subunit beta [Woeseiaceae bacterium]
MKIAESWLREWVDPDLTTEELGHQLTMLGHEVDEIAAEGEGIAEVVVAEVLECGKHPDADKLSVCKVSDGGGELIDIVCGAPNARVGLKTPLAKPGVTLPNGMKLRKAKIRGVVSNGMLCSAVELGLGDESDGILELPCDAQPGQPLVELLGLPDAVIDVDLTPNRGDCFSILGIARDLAALTGTVLKDEDVAPVIADIDDTHPVELVEPAGCPRFAGRLVRGIDPAARSPLWLAERLRRAGLRSISPVVDVTNYVMLELGQPLHAYDAALLNGPIRPRLAKKGEQVTLLDEKVVELSEDTLVITDDSGPIGMAGIMGGLSTAVGDTTTDVFFEAAFWPQDFMAGRARQYGMHTDASLRFERGVDPQGQGRAVERATELLLQIAGGQAGPLVDDTVAEHLPRRADIVLRKQRVTHLLGLEIDDEEVRRILESLQMRVEHNTGGWTVAAPSHRFDIKYEVDLIEEIARIHGYDSIPETTLASAAPLEAVTESRIEMERAAATLIARDYQEVVTYSFIDPDANRKFTGHDSELVLSNPIAEGLSVMRGSLWPGLVAAAAANAARQQERVRVFEASRSYHGTLGEHTEVVRLAGLATGPIAPEQWGARAQSVDLFDIKADVEAVLALACGTAGLNFAAVEHPALQPGQAAEILRGDTLIGVIGKLHPKLAREYDLKRPTYLFELDAEKALASKVPAASEVSKFPVIRRDIAVVVDAGVSAHELVAAVAASAPDLIRDVRLFDIYTGEGIEAGRKSVAIGLILQETSRTLTDEDADSAMAAAVAKLEHKFAAYLRD